MACQMQGFVFIRIIGLLENSYIICTAFVKICILIRIHRIHFKTYHLEIFPGNLAGFSDIFYIGFGFAFTGKDQDFLKAGFCNSCHFLLNLFLIQLCTADLVVAVKSTVNTVIFAMNAYDNDKYTEADVRRALAHDNRTPEDFQALLSPAALPLLEEIAQAARIETRKHFGNSVCMFTPIYIANYCENYCIYCGFNCHFKNSLLLKCQTTRQNENTSKFPTIRKLL